ncbi:N-acetylmuramoyl-L-alanine amidase [Maribacter sp. R77961]|uniref:N-acetylmuramoyl-L-alanine amidase n=1 Tax=Maribacter sp. R77961 TaxID=3093871 RepID=UPI0037CAC31A
MKIKQLSTLVLIVVSLLTSSFNDLEQPNIMDDPFVVVLDAGHGGHDPGNLGNGYLEKDIALKIVLKVGEILSANKDIKVIYTRKDDTFIDLFVRGEVANKANADLFVSVHCDSHSSDAHGAGTFVLGLHANKQNFEIAKKENSVIYLEDNYETRYANYDINSPESVIGLTIMQEEFLDQSIALAKIIQDNFSKKLKRTDRKVKQAGFIVLHQTFMPSVLVETGFLTNKNEGAYLNSNKGQAEMGTAIANAILNYKEQTQNNVAPSFTAENPATVDKKEAPEIVEAGGEEIKEEMEIKKVMEPATPVVAKETTVVNEVMEKKPAVSSPVIADKSVEEDIKAVVTKNSSETEKPNKSIIFKVQLMASGKNLPLTSENFNGLGRLSKEPYKNLYRYLYGETASYREAEMMKSNAAIKGYPTAYIVAYKNGERISVPEARKQVAQ